MTSRFDKIAISEVFLVAIVSALILVFAKRNVIYIDSQNIGAPNNVIETLKALLKP
jgi:hypothetical protein